MKSATKLIAIISIILISCSDGNELQSRKEVLECVLDCYINHFKIEEDRLIVINDHQGWTDTSSIVIVNSHLKERKLIEGEVLEAKYRNIEISFHHGTLIFPDSLFVDLDNLENAISNNFKWKKVNKPIQSRKEIALPEQFDEIQLVHKPKDKCIEIVIMGHQELKSAIENQCKFCK